METAFPDFKVKSKSRFLQASCILVVASAIAMGSQSALAQTAPCTLTDIDRDDDGLIEICDLEGLNAIRYQLDGTGYKAGEFAPVITVGCRLDGGCKGYELTRDLDFNDDNSYNTTANKVVWTTGAGWEPIGYNLGYYYPHNRNRPFMATFDGNGHTISNLMINRSLPTSLRTRGAWFTNVKWMDIGLFGYVVKQSKIRNIGLFNVDVVGAVDVGGLVGYNYEGTITSSYATGSVEGGHYIGGLVGYNHEGTITSSYATGSVKGQRYNIGGLVGYNYEGTITSSYATGFVTGRHQAGGLVGSNDAGFITNTYATGSAKGYSDIGGLVGYNYGGTITSSYATGSVSGHRRIGGLVGTKPWRRTGTYTNSYWDKQTSGRETSAGGGGKTTLALQEPTTATGIYRSWSTEVWDFGTSAQYPALRYSDGTVMPNQPRESLYIPQMPQIEIAGVPTGAVAEGDRITLTASSPDNASDISLNYSWSQTSGGTLLIEPTTLSSVTIEVPEDYVSADANTINLAVMLIAMSDEGNITRQIEITIAKRNNGQITALGEPSLNERVLTAPAIDLNGDPDGSVSTIGYQWQSRENSQTTRTAWVNVPAGTSESYTIPGNVFGTVQYRVVVSYTDRQGYSEQVISQAIVYESRYSLIEIASLTSCGTTDIDQDDDGLIEICNLEGLNAIRNQMDGTGYKAHESAPVITIGCRLNGGCTGYELTRDLDFNDDDSYSSTSNKVVWTTGAGWSPLGHAEYRQYQSSVSTNTTPFNAIFEGNSHTISNLNIDRFLTTNEVGLFGRVGSQARINGVGLINVNVRANWAVGGLVGFNNQGVISNSYVTGFVRGNYGRTGGLVGLNSNGSIANSYAVVLIRGGALGAGGLVGSNHGRIIDSYAMGSIEGMSAVGGLVGNSYGGSITNSYATSEVSGSSSIGGLIGLNDDADAITSSYWDRWTSGQMTSAGGEGKTTIELQSLTVATGIYSSWSTDVWDFGTNSQYPTLKYSDGTVMSNQPRGRPDLSQKLGVEITGVPTDAVAEGNQIMLEAFSDYSMSNDIPLHYRWEQTSGKVLRTDSTTLSMIWLEVPEDYVEANANSSDITLILKAVSDVGITTQQVVMTIAKRNNGQIAALGAPSLNERVLTAPAIDLSGDPDGGVSTIGYQWQSRESTEAAWANVVDGTSEAYTAPKYTGGVVQYRVVVSYTDGQGYSEEVISQAVVYESRYSLIEIASLTSCGTTDIDQDDDGLIEICDLEGLNAIRYRLDGTGYKANESAPVITMGCRPNGGCIGYELTRDLDFNDVNSYSSTSNKVVWTTGDGWSPLGHAEYRQYQSSVSTNTTPFNAIFEGNSHTISNLNIDRFLTTNEVGLFGRVGSQARINGVGLINVNVRANWAVGGLVGFNNQGVISNSYVTGFVRGNYGRTGGLVGLNSNGSIANSYAVVLIRGGALGAGGLVGSNHGRIIDSYAMGSIEGMSAVGGLVGNSYGGSITNSYATSEVSGSSSIGGLIGLNDDADAITSSYWDRWTSGQMTSAGGEGKTTIELQSLTVATGIYSSWSTQVWDFGTSEQYPALKYSDGTFMPNQGRVQPEDVLQMSQVEIAGVPAGAINEGDSITLTASSSDNTSNIPLRYRWTQISDGDLLIEPTTRSSVTIEVPEDYVSADANTVNLAIMLDVISDVGSTAQQVVITIAKRNNGKVAALGAPSLNERVLTAPAIDLSGDPDGGVSTIGYQWQSRESTATAWINVPAGTSEAYTIPENVFGTVQYRVVMSYTDGQGYSEEIISQAVVYESIDIPVSIVVLVSCSTTDIDQDDDGLIEICDLEGLNAMRYQMDGTGYKASGGATKITLGCPATGCKGYELTRDLDFNDDASYRNASANKRRWTTGAGWPPIGNSSSNAFGATFDGSGHTIANLIINRASSANIGLFGYTGRRSKINNIGLLNINVTGDLYVGGLVGRGDSIITNSYAKGSVKGADYVGGLVGLSNGAITSSYATGSATATSSFAEVGGLVGRLYGSVMNSYATGSVTGAFSYFAIGGLVGLNDGDITNSYATGFVTGNDNVGGLVGRSRDGGSVTDSYWDTETSGSETSAGRGGAGKTTAQLQSPITATGIYRSWSTDVWDFGTSEQYPALKYSDGTVIPNQGREPLENVPQMLQVQIAGVPAGAIDEGDSITLTASSPSNASNIPLSYRWSQTSGGDLLIEPTTLSSVTIEVPEDYMPNDASAVNLAIMLNVISNVGSTTQQVVITIAKRNNGKIAALGAPSLNERELTAPAIDLSDDPDGGGSTIGYQWQSREGSRTAWVNVPAGKNEAYTIPENVFGTVQYRVIMSYTDGQGYSEEVISQAMVYEREDFSQPVISIANPTSCEAMDIDQDDDGLIELCNLEGLNAIRYQLDGTGYRQSTLQTKITAGCPATGCKGYELANNLDFNDFDSYSSTTNKVIWTTGSGWQPIGAWDNPFTAIFKANRYRISNLMINRPSSGEMGLFGRIAEPARIEGVGLINVSVRGNWGNGSLVGHNSRGVISNSYATGRVMGGDSVGGLVGDNYGTITNSYTNVSVSGGSYIGGIVGCNFGGATITNSYTVPRISRGSSTDVGGILGFNSPNNSGVFNSYWDIDVSGISGGGFGLGLTTIQLQSPIAPGSTQTEIYYGWDSEVWDFGTFEQYPVLKYRDNTVIPEQPEEQPGIRQMPQVEIVGVPSGAIGEGERITLTASSQSSASLSYRWTQISDGDLLIEPTTRSSVTLAVPKDYVPVDANTVNLAIMLDVISDVGSTAQQVVITIAKRNNGRISALGAPSINDRVLTASAIDLSGDPDGGVGTIGYQWQSRESTATAWINVPAGTSEAYTAPKYTRDVVQYRVIVSYTDGQGYNEEVASDFSAYQGLDLLQGLSVEVIGVPTKAVAEGERITLTASSQNSEINVPLSYRWTQTSGKALFITTTTQASVILEVPEDYVAPDADTANAVLTLEASSYVGIITRQIEITIAKRNNGQIAALGAPSLNDRVLTTPAIDLSGDPDGGVGTIGYQWQSRESTATAWINVPAGTSEVYTAPKYTSGIVQYRVIVSYTDGQGYSEEVASDFLAYRGLDLLQGLSVEVIGVPTEAVAEGERITLTASSQDSEINVPLSYRWTQTSGKALFITTTTQASVILEVPEDYVAPDADTANAVLTLEASSYVGIITRQIEITIAKRNNGQIATLGAPSLSDRMLTAPAIDLSGDPDGGVSGIGYQWQSRESTATAWAHVVGGTSEVYTAPKYTRGIVQYRVIVNYTDGQGYNEEVASDFSAYRGKTNTAPSIDVPSDNSSIRLLSGQTTRVSVVISEVDAEDIVTLTIAQILTMTEIVLVEPPGILLGADLGETRTAEFELTALQEGLLRLRLTATDDSGTLTARAATVELSIEIEALPLTSCGTTDVDQDDDGLIEICSLEGLNAIRYEINGSGYRESESAIKSTVGCGEGGCRGYELSNDLDFNNDAHYQDIANKSTWTTGAGWKPLSLITRFEGNDNTISNLMINRELENDIGLFGHASGGGTKINGVGLIDVDIGGRRAVGGLVGRMGGGGIVSNSYVTGDVIGHAQTGGLVGSSLHSSISDSYAIVYVEAIGTANISSFVGGLVGSLLASRVSGSHAIGSVKGLGRVGGLVGSNIGANGHIINSYAIANVEGSNNSVGGLIGSNNGISGSVVSSYATGKVVGVNVVGGLVGNNERNYTIRDSYSFADVRGNFSVGGLAGVHVGHIINSYAVGRVEGNLGERGIGGLVGVKSEDATITASYWDKTTSEKAQSDGGEGKITALLQSATTATGIYSSWNPGVWDFGTATQYPALKSGDGTPMPDQRIGLSGLSVLTSEEIPYLFNTEVFNYRLMIANEADTIKLLPTATPGVTNIGITSDNGFSESVLSGNQSSPISLAASGMTIVTVQVEFASQASRTYRLMISRSEQSVAVQLVGMNQPFEYVIPRNTVRGRSGDSMQGYTVMRMPSWLDYAESESGLMFSGTPEADYLEDSLEEMLEVKINNVDGTTQIVCLILQIDSPTTGTTVLEELPDGVLQLNDRLSDDNGIEEKTHVWEHCPVGSDAFSELDGVDGMRYTLPEGPNSAPGTAYRVRTTIIDGLGRRSEHTTQIELQGQVTEESQTPISDEAPQRGIRIRAKVFLEGFLQ